MAGLAAFFHHRYSHRANMASAKSSLDGSGSTDHLADLLAAIARSDQNALAEVYDSTSPVVFGFVRRILNNPSLAEEVTLEVYLRVWRNAASYDPTRGAPWTWLLMLARSCAIDSRRSSRREQYEQPLEDLGSFADDSPNAEETATDNGRHSDIRSALELLTPAQREAIELSFYFGLTHAEIAARLGQPLGTVKSHIRIGMLRLRDHLESYEPSA